MPDVYQSQSSQTEPHGIATIAAGQTDSRSLTERARKWLKQHRGIGESVLTPGLVYSEISAGGEVIVFPYVFRGEVVNHKYRGEGKKFWQDKGAVKALYNIDCVRANPDHLFFVEGEVDALSLIFAGVWNAVSVPDGAPDHVNDDLPDPGEDAKFEYLLTCADELKGRRFVIATDNDHPGRCLREELVRRLGRGNCDVVEWPEGIKDANEYLLANGPDALRDYVSAARKPYPIKGLSSWGDVLPVPPETTYGVGIGKLDRMVRLARGTMSVVTGIPNHGKSTLAKQIACEMVRNHGWRVTIASFEDQVYRQLMPELVNIYTGVPPEAITGQQRGDAVAKLSRHVSFIFDEGVLDEAMDIGWLVRMIRDAKRRFGTDLLILDPWNEIEHAWGRDQNETQYLGIALKEIRRLSVDLGIHIMVVAHPTKIQGDHAPGLYDIAGSANWANKVDIGLVVHQPEFANGPGGPTEVFVRKIKRPSLGYRGTVELQFNERRRSFEEAA